MTKTDDSKPTTATTPGPWEDNGNGLIYGQCSGDDDEAPFVADVCSDPNAYTEQEQANARLIAAAPDLLKACKVAMHRGDNCLSDETLQTLDAAIAKATAA